MDPRLLVILPSLLAALVFFTGCARTPVVTDIATSRSGDAGRSGDTGAVVRMLASAPSPGDRSTTNGMTTTAVTQTPSSVDRPSPKEFTRAAALDDAHFDFDRYEIRPADAKVLEANARWLRDHPGPLVLIEGHTDPRGTNEYNLALGDRRAKATKSYLVAHGVRQDRITIVTYGEERPVCTEPGEGCWAKNRRAHFLIKE